jgi:O-antigen ligase
MEQQKEQHSKLVRYSWITTHYYIIAIMMSFIYLFWDGMRAGVISAAFMSFIVVEYIYRNRKISINKITLVLIIYLYYNLITIPIAIFRGYPFSLSITVFSNAILPIVFYFIAIEMSDLEEHKFNKSYIYACLFLVLVGIYMYVTYPNIYHEYMVRHIFNYSKYQEYYRMYPRMNSFTNSIIVGSMASMGLALAINPLIFRKKSLGLSILTCVILLIGILLTMQRSAWGFVVIIFIMIIPSTFKSRRSLLRFIFTVAVSAIVFSYIAFEYKDLMEQFLSRILNITSAIGERNSEWNYVWLRGVGSLFIGDGLGTRGHQAMQINNLTIRDGYYVKMLFEVGVIGSIMFIGIMISTIIKGFRKYKKCLPYLCIVIGILVQSIGSNILDFQLVAPMFWFSVGRINRIEKKYSEL